MTARETRRALHRYGLARDRFTAAVGQATNLTSTEVEALEHLEEEGPLTQQQLADRLFLTSGGTTLLVDRLERDGFVSRRPHPSDRRAVLLELNQAAAPQTSPALEHYHAAVMAAARKLSAAEREAVAGFSTRPRLPPARPRRRCGRTISVAGTSAADVAALAHRDIRNEVHDGR